MSPADHAVATRAKRIRLDQVLVDRGLVGTRSRGQALVLGGKVWVGDGDGARRDHKPGDLIPADAAVRIDAPEPYVSRGGHKLVAALDAFAISPRGMVVLDVGASTGGFTDVVLQRGARHVHAIDVGRGQLDQSLRVDPRVTSLERTNARTLTATSLPEPIDLAVIDVSFISLLMVLAPVASTLAPAGSIVALVKPQFEVGKGGTDKGVVRDPAVHREVLEALGNREFLVHLVPGPAYPAIGDRIRDVVMPTTMGEATDR
jgi:23S rRNA (cytidine1920-2'-O)/16S rRNA (cytidine1409-2'-O)-methyltransferase